MPSDRSLPAISWVAAADNPWGVPVLDVRPITQGLISVSQDPTCASNAVSFKRDDGTGFIGQEPESRREIAVDLRYGRDRLLADGALFIPSAMEDKWALFVHRGRILCVRSWRRAVALTAAIEQSESDVRIVRIRGTFSNDDEPPATTARLMDCLIRTHALGEAYPVPLAPGMADNAQEAALYCMALFGRIAECATPHEFPRPLPAAPLRSHSLLHIAVARGDAAGVETQIAAGIPVDLPARDGLPPMHWALARPDTAMLELLSSKGSSVDARSLEGATALMTATQKNDMHAIRWLLDHHADVNARDARGFTALHRAAEMGHGELVDLLLRRGADPRVSAEGHTAESLASGRGHAAIVARLRRGP